MATINERIWQRHAHPWSGWVAIATYPLVYVPVWNRSWRQAFAVAAWLAVDTVGFPPPQDNAAWMTRAMLGEQRWMQHPPRDSSMVIVAAQMASAVTAFVMAYQRRLWPLIGFASMVLLFKLWFLQRMAASYGQQHREATSF